MAVMFRFGCGHVEKDEALHEASWGARLIYDEIVRAAKGSGTSVVWDRQTPDGEPESVQSLFPVIDRAIDQFRAVRYELEADSRGRLCWREGRALVVMSPQGSYGYLYVTAVLERDGHEGETKLAEFEDAADMRKFPQLGNWPPEVVAAREEKERKYQRAALLGAVSNAAQEGRWAMRAMWGAKTERSKKIAQNKVTKWDDATADARQAAFAAGFTEAEIDKATRGY